MEPRKQIAVFGSFLANPQSIEYGMAEELGYLLAKDGFKVVCGGHGGIVTPLVAGVNRGGGEVLGISLAAAKNSQRNAEMNPQLTETVFVGSIAERLEFFLNAGGFVFFSGGIGSLAEFAFIWHSLQVAGDFGRPMIFISKGWKRTLAEIRREQMIKHKYYGHIHVCEQVEEAMAILTDDYSLKYRDSRNIFRKEDVLFDLDGIIVESPEEEFIRSCENAGYFFHLPDVVESFRMAKHLRGTLDDYTTTRDDSSFTTRVLENLGIDGRSANGIADRVCKEFNRIPELYADAKDCLRYFKEKGFSIGIVSKRHPLDLQEIVSAHDLAGLFDFIGAFDLPAEKPGLRTFAEALELSGFSREGTIFIGVDSPEENPGLRAIDCDSILLDRHLTHLLADKACKIRSLRELMYMVEHGAVHDNGDN